MKKINFLFVLGFVAISSVLTSCSRVDAGYVGVKVNLLGEEKGLQQEVLGVGRYFIGINEELYTYPTFQINYVYTSSEDEGSPLNEEFSFQTQEGMECTVDLGVSAHYNSEKITSMFQTYRKGPDEIRNIVIRNEIRDALNKVAGNVPVEAVYGAGKGKLIDTVKTMVANKLEPNGIVIDNIYLIGSIRIPVSVKSSLDAKVQATQEAMKSENQVRQAEAKAKIKVANAEGDAKSIIVKAEAQAKANRLIAESLTQTLVEYKKIEKWNGVNSSTVLSNGSSTLINVK